LQLLTPPGGILEVRAPKPWTASGYFDADHLPAAAEKIEALDATGTYDGIYIVLNEITPALLSRRANRIETRLPKAAATTADADIIRRRWFPVDIDVKRPSGISSTDEEHAAALEGAGKVARYLSEEHGFPEPIRADSGNGAHLLYRIDLPNDEGSRALIERCLKALGAAFDRDPSENQPGWEIDKTTFNAARIWKLYGTVARKGDNTPERPHRRARILEVPETVEPVRIEDLAGLAAQAPAEEQPRQEFRPRNGGAPGIDLEDWLREYGASLPPYQAKSKTGFRTFYLFDVCPWDPAHRDKSAFVGQRTDGPLVAGCHHNGCSGNGWKDLRALVEPKRPKPTPVRKEPRPEAVTAGAPDATPGMNYSALSTVTKQGAVRLDYQAIADILIARYAPVTFQKQIWVYDGGLYRREQGEILSFVSEVARAVGFTAGITTVVREVTAYVSAYEIAAEYPFDRYPNALPVANGVLVLDWTTDSATLRPYAPEHRFTGKWPVVYDPAADPGPIHDQALSLYVDDDALPALYQLPAHAILHFCGYGPFKRSYILEGPTNGGKSTYLVDFLNAIFGEQSISNASLQEIGTNRFVTGVLERKIINRCDDLADVPLANAGPFKKLTGGFSHDIERKHEREYVGRITCVHAFTCNTPPPVPENVAFDGAFWNRWIYLRCNNVFDIDPGFVRRTFTPENVAGAFNRILEMAFEIRRRGDLVYSQDPGEVKDTWQTAANPFEQFVSAEMMTAKEPARFDKGKLYRIFLDWCGQNDISPRKVPGSLTGFTQLIFGSGFKPARRGADRERVYEAPKTWKPDSKYREWL
jgi:phage/plasmid-associated DNA primase